MKVKEIARIDADANLLEMAATMVDAHTQIAVVGRPEPDAQFVTLPSVMDAIVAACGKGAGARMTVQMVLALAIFLIAYVFIATERVSRVTVALVGAALMVIIGATDGHAIFFSQESGIDWNVIFLLLGMMMIVGILQQTGVFEFLAIWAAKRARGRPFVIMVMLVLITAVLSAALDNVTTVLLDRPGHPTHQRPSRRVSRSRSSSPR